MEATGASAPVVGAGVPVVARRDDALGRRTRPEADGTGVEKIRHGEGRQNRPGRRIDDVEPMPIGYIELAIRNIERNRRATRDNSKERSTA